MPAIIAFSLCTLFVVFLLWLDHKQFPEASLALWVPTIWFLIATSRALGAWTATGAGNVEMGSALDRNVLLLLLILGIFITKKRNYNITNVLRQNPTVLLMISFMFISISWSDIPFVSFKRWFRNIIVIYMAMVIASEVDPKKAMLCILRRMIYVHIPFSILLIRFYGDLGRAYGRWSGEVSWSGVATQKNGLVYICAVSLLYFIWTYVRRARDKDRTFVWYQKYIEILIALMSIYLFMGPGRSLTYSATSLAALLMALTALFGFLLLKKYKVVIGANLLTIFIVAAMIYGTALPFIGKFTLVDPTSALNRSSTITDRSDVWAALLPFATQKPILGHGVGGFWTNDRRQSYYFPAHNGYLETILDTGFIGLFFFAMFMISNCRKAHRLMLSDIEWGALWFCFLLMVLARNMTESVAVSLAQGAPAILLFMSISLGINTKKS